MTLKTTVMMLKIQLCFTGINYNLKYIKTENFKKLQFVFLYLSVLIRKYLIPNILHELQAASALDPCVV